jgi:hypothetical protein
MAEKASPRDALLEDAGRPKKAGRPAAEAPRRAPATARTGAAAIDTDITAAIVVCFRVRCTGERGGQYVLASRLECGTGGAASMG